MYCRPRSSPHHRILLPNCGAPSSVALITGSAGCTASVLSCPNFQKYHRQGEKEREGKERRGEKTRQKKWKTEKTCGQGSCSLQHHKRSGEHLRKSCLSIQQTRSDSSTDVVPIRTGRFCIRAQCSRWHSHMSTPIEFWNNFGVWSMRIEGLCGGTTLTLRLYTSWNSADSVTAVPCTAQKKANLGIFLPLLLP